MNGRLENREPYTIPDPKFSYPVNGPRGQIYGGITGFNEWMTPIGALLSPQNSEPDGCFRCFIEDLEKRWYCSDAP